VTSATLLLDSGLRTATGGLRMGTHTWVTDELFGLCRLDPSPVDGSLGINLSTCNTTVTSPGQAAFDPTTNAIYAADKTSQGVGAVWRLIFDPVTETIKQPASGVLTSTPGGPALLATLGTGRPFSVVLGPDHKVYIGQLKSPNIVRIDPAAATPTAVTIGQTSDGQGVKGIAFVGNDLYLGETVAVSKLANAPACSGACAAAVTPFLVAAPSALAADPSGVIYVADTPTVSGGKGPSTIRRYRLSTGTQDVLATAGTLADGTSSPLNTVGALWVDSGTLMVGDLGPNGLGRLWKVPPAP
jgi:DNA-binding beta-propeller fold protein YncE